MAAELVVEEVVDLHPFAGPRIVPVVDHLAGSEVGEIGAFLAHDLHRAIGLEDVANIAEAAVAEQRLGALLADYRILHPLVARDHSPGPERAPRPGEGVDIFARVEHVERAQGPAPAGGPGRGGHGGKAEAGADGASQEAAAREAGKNIVENHGHTPPAAIGPRLSDCGRSSTHRCGLSA